jgi:glycosyltransferase involved in cell wall biosynthesis
VRQYARRCDLIIAPSPTIRDLLDQYGIATWTVTLQNAIDLSRFEQLPDRQLLRQQLGWPQEARVALYAGRLGKEKNLDFLLEAHRRVYAQDARALLMILGDGPERQRLQRQGVAGVHFLGPCSYADVPGYFRAADFFTICSTTEVKPLVVLEALAAGLPVVAVSACGTQDTLSEGFDGLLTPHRLEPFAASWLRLVEDPALVQRLSEGALQTARQYGMETYGQKLVELYREALARLGGA